MLKPSNLTPSPFKSLIRFLILVLLPAIQSGTAAPFRAPQNQDELARGSRKAIIDTGFSADYFDKHFKLIQVIDKPGDTRVVWQFTHDEYQIRISDSLGYYTAGGRKIYTHSIGNNLGKTRNIGKTLTKQRARQRMRSCLGGRFVSESVMLTPLQQNRQAGLYLVAYAARGGSKDDESERERYEKNRPADDQDRPPVEGDRERPMTVGYINLETGKCLKGEASATP